jgi:hypothetical protein
MSNLLSDCNISRVKVECAPVEHLFNVSHYLEVHFETHIDLNQEGSMISHFSHLPLSVNKISNKYIRTDREYDKRLYNKFIEKYQSFGDIELCIFDTNVNGDKKWFEAYSL